MPQAKVNGINLYFEREGKGHPLVLIGNQGSDLSWWKPVRKQLARDFDLILFDARGSGRTTCPKSPFSLEHMAKDTLALMEHLQLRKPHILGQSMGGAIAQILAYRHPEKISKVILSQTFIKVLPVPQAAARAMLQKAPLRQRVETALPWFFSNRFLADKKKTSDFIKQALANPTFFLGQAQQLRAATRFNSTSWYRKISKPVLVLAGDEDNLCPLHESLTLASGIANAQLHIFPHTSHSAPHETPDAYCQQVRKFL